jgi:hypothetical protein
MRTKSAVNRKLPLSEFLGDCIDSSTQLPTAPRGENGCEAAHDQPEIASKYDRVNWRRPPSGPHATTNRDGYRPPALNASFQKLTVRTDAPWASPKLEGHLDSPLSDVSNCSSHETVVASLTGASPDRYPSHPCSPHDSPKLRPSAFGSGRPRELVLAERAKRSPAGSGKPGLCDWRSQRSPPIDRSSPMHSPGIPELDRIEKMTPGELAALFSY